MAMFYGKVQGQRGEATRLGGRKSGLTTTAASWQGAVKTTLSDRDGTAWAHVELIPWHGQGTSQVLYSGPVSGMRQTTAKSA
jgi:hypothetical protein